MSSKNQRNKTCRKGNRPCHLVVSVCVWPRSFCKIYDSDSIQTPFLFNLNYFMLLTVTVTSFLLSFSTHKPVKRGTATKYKISVQSSKSKKIRDTAQPEILTAIRAKHGLIILHGVCCATQVKKMCVAEEATGRIT